MKKTISFLLLFTSFLPPLPSLCSYRETGLSVRSGPSPVNLPTQILNPGSFKGEKIFSSNIPPSVMISIINSFDFFWDENNDGSSYRPVVRFDTSRIFSKYIKTKTRI
ncbi:hypothetical protein JW890_07200 [candidate division WOR-3 bacterium]|nr:hypothetical protein [candidate division WOR-3 bacterium]